MEDEVALCRYWEEQLQDDPNAYAPQFYMRWITQQAFIQRNPEEINNISELIPQKPFWQKIVVDNPHFYKKMPAEFIDHKFWKEFLMKNPEKISERPELLTIDLCQTVVEKYKWLMQHHYDLLKPYLTEEFLCRVVEQYPSAIKDITAASDKLWEIAIMQRPNLIQVKPNTTGKLWRSAAARMPSLIYRMPRKFITEEFILNFVKNNPTIVIRTDTYSLSFTQHTWEMLIKINPLWMRHTPLGVVTTNFFEMMLRKDTRNVNYMPRYLMRASYCRELLSRPLIVFRIAVRTVEKMVENIPEWSWRHEVIVDSETGNSICINSIRGQYLEMGQLRQGQCI